jgi:hypothetical protein
MKAALTITDIEAAIESQHCWKVGMKTTLCLTTLVNGFEIVTSSSCVDPAMYNEEIGAQIAKERGVDKVWELEGYVLQNDRFLADVMEDEALAEMEDELEFDLDEEYVLPNESDEK